MYRSTRQKPAGARVPPHEGEMTDGPALNNCSTTNLFRQMPNALLTRYFNGKGRLADLDFAGILRASCGHERDEAGRAGFDLARAAQRATQPDGCGLPQHSRPRCSLRSNLRSGPPPVHRCARGSHVASHTPTRGAAGTHACGQGEGGARCADPLRMEGCNDVCSRGFRPFILCH